ncbi:MAG: DNA mismatch repair endonuclease MutL, partial [Firmicutes bacterium]|nr:DNA mismatch repair endonuclease MutL [Bacillota bacterium]
MTYEKIRQLPKDIADKIAAGEVVERPLSIVKELAENAVDAGASFITVEISRGGKEYIRVSDNGKGIPKDQLALAVRRYASSKIYTEEDLSSIETLGFRGEALASIGAVSALEIVSKPASQSRGAGIRVEGGAESEPYDAACENGTTVIVRDLFYNLPARRKFLRADNAETSLITDFVSKLAIAYPSIRVRLISNGTILFSTTGKGDLRQAILTVYSRAVSDSLLPVDRSGGGIRVSGFVSDPLSGRTSRRYQIFFVNGRLIRSKLIEGALDYAYRDKMFEGRYPAAFLFISVPPESVDVNIHPSKTEIRFFDEQPLRDAVILAVRSALMDPAALAVRDEELGSGADPAVSSAGAAAAGMHASSAGDASYIPAVSLPSRADALGELARLRESSRSSGSEAHEVEIQEEIGVYGADGEERFSFSSLETVDIVFSTYIIAKDDSFLYFIDQHAAHERVLYEKLTRRFSGAESGSQILLAPELLSPGAAVKQALEAAMPRLSEMGFELEDFGPGELLLRAVPSCMEL